MAALLRDVELNIKWCSSGRRVTLSREKVDPDPPANCEGRDPFSMLCKSAFLLVAIKQSIIIANCCFSLLSPSLPFNAVDQGK